MLQSCSFLPAILRAHELLQRDSERFREATINSEITLPFCGKRVCKEAGQVFIFSSLSGGVVILPYVFIRTADNFLNFVINKTGGILLLSATPFLPQVMHMICSGVPGF